jgi:hypothetical protein
MSLKKVIEAAIEKIETALGKGLLFLEAHIGAVEEVENFLIKWLANPAVDLVLETELGPQIISQIPNLVALLTKAVQDELAGTKIITDVNAQATIDGKLKVLIADIQATPGMNKGIIRDVCLALLAMLNNNALDNDSYALYYLAKKKLAA